MRGFEDGDPSLLFWCLCQAKHKADDKRNTPIPTPTPVASLKILHG